MELTKKPVIFRLTQLNCSKTQEAVPESLWKPHQSKDMLFLNRYSDPKKNLTFFCRRKNIFFRRSKNIFRKIQNSFSKKYFLLGKLMQILIAKKKMNMTRDIKTDCHQYLLIYFQISKRKIFHGYWMLDTACWSISMNVSRVWGLWVRCLSVKVLKSGYHRPSIRFIFWIIKGSNISSHQVRGKCVW